MPKKRQKKRVKAEALTLTYGSLVVSQTRFIVLSKQKEVYHRKMNIYKFAKNYE